MRHYGHTEKPKGELGENALYQDRDPDSYSNRSLLANVFETAAQSEEELEKSIYYGKCVRRTKRCAYSYLNIFDSL